MKNNPPTITNKQLRAALAAEFPSAKKFILDGEYDLLPEEVYKKAYLKFVFRMQMRNLFKWLKNKLDCDKWAWIFKSNLTLRNALSKRKNALPIGILCYNINGEVGRGHCINVYAHLTYGGEWMIKTLEPQPNNGNVRLTEKEKEATWLVIF